MCAVPPLPRESSRVSNVAVKLHCTPMPTRRHGPVRRPSKVIIEALKAFSRGCECKSTLIVSCAVGAVSGCRERQHEGTCGCRPRELPVCILETPDGMGCQFWREGKACPCWRLHMPRCLAVGCDVRRKGKRCECPRTPTDICKHVLAQIRTYAALTHVGAEEKANEWAELLWSLLPEWFADRPLPCQGYVAATHEDAVNLMMVRHSKLKRGLWHPDDVRGLDGGGLSEQQRLRRQASGFQRLIRAAQAAKKNGGAA